MNIRVPLLNFPALLLFVSCATQEPKVTGWLGSEVFKMPPGAFMSETLELKDGRFRYWFSSDVIIRGGQKYPIEGNYAFKGDELALSSGKVLKVRQINGRRVLLWPLVVEDWDRQQIIPGAHILLPVESIDSEPPIKDYFFTKEQREQSARKARELVEKSK